MNLLTTENILPNIFKKAAVESVILLLYHSSVLLSDLSAKKHSRSFCDWAASGSLAVSAGDKFKEESSVSKGHRERGFRHTKGGIEPQNNFLFRADSPKTRVYPDFTVFMLHQHLQISVRSPDHLSQKELTGSPAMKISRRQSVFNFTNL